jgi:anti-sigma regulatory factor (Ser/Thr protein kinase)
MEVTEYAQLSLANPTCVGEARRAGAKLARGLGFSDGDVGRVALVVTEAATNVVKHAAEGELLLRALRRGTASGVGVLVLDRGPGIRTPGEALRDGFSTGGTPGTGLGGMARVATRFDLYSAHGVGAAVSAEIWDVGAPEPHGMCVGGISVPCPGETVCGDAWAVHEGPDQTQAIVADGLGHGGPAAEASLAAVAAFRRAAGDPPTEALQRVHEALRPTRGAAVAIAVVDRRRKLVRFAGIGNVSATVVSGDATRSLVSHHGTAGGVARRIQEFQYPWSAGDVLVLHSDGLGTHWKLTGYPGLAQHDPSLVAGVLYRDHRRGRDDTTVVALREAA